MDTRNKIIFQGLRENGVKIIECQSRAAGVKKYVELTKKFWPIRHECSIIYVAFAGYVIVPLAWVLAKITGKKIVFDAFMSVYDSMILDRKIYKKFSIKSLKYFFLDWLSCKLAGIIFLDADEYIKYFVKTFRIKKFKFRRIFVGSDDSILRPREQKKANSSFLVHFHGSSNLPLHGVDYIIRAAKILEKEDIKFEIIGRLDTYREAINLSGELGLKNLDFIDFVPYEKLGDYIARADVCLGKFGVSEKASRCSSFKVIEAAAMAKPLITGDTPAMREILEDRKNCLFCKMTDAEDLAIKILELKNNPGLRKEIAKNIYQTYLKYFTPKAIGLEIKNIFAEALKQSA